MPTGSMWASTRGSSGKAIPVASPRRPAPDTFNLGTKTTSKERENTVRRPFDISSPARLVPLASALALCLATSAHAQSGDPIKIAVIAEMQSIAGAATPGGAQIAADEINAKGGVLGRKIEIVSYDNKSSSADSLRAFQRAVSEDKC